ncbi:MAG: hypothetical protein ACRD26_11460 [Vicinamibacterales bacterium]
MTVRAFVVIALVAFVTSASPAQSRREPRRVGLDEQARLHEIVEQAAAGKPAGGNAWLKWAPHFLRGPGGRTYVPFTLRIDEAPGAFRAAAMYVRVAPRGDQGRAGKRAEGVQNALGVATGELPINSPERRQGVGAPTATDASLMLRSLTAKGAGAGYPYEAAYGVEPAADGKAATVQRALAVGPGEYDLYIALLERDQKGEKKWALLKQPLTVPDLAASGLRVSSVILADRVDSLAAPVPLAEQALRPYVFGTAELVPAADDELRRDETLHVAFLIYDATADAGGKPDVRVEYRLYQRNFASERLLGATPPQTLDVSTLPAGFDLRAGQQLAAMQSLPLTTYKPGTYRLAIRVIDNRSGTTADEQIQFVIVS